MEPVTRSQHGDSLMRLIGFVVPVALLAARGIFQAKGSMNCCNF